MLDGLQQTKSLLNEDLENHFARRNMRILSQPQENNKVIHNQQAQITKLNLDVTLPNDAKSIYTPLSVTRYNYQKDQRFHSAVSSPRNHHHSPDIPNSLMIQDSKNIQLMNDNEIIKLSYLPKLHSSLNHRRMKMDQYSSPWEQIKKIAQNHNTPVLFEQHQVFGTSLTGFDGNVSIKPLFTPKSMQQRREQTADVNLSRHQKNSNEKDFLILKNDKIRQNLTQQAINMNNTIDEKRRNSQEQINQTIINDTFRDIQKEKMKNQKIKQLLSFNKQQYLNKFWSSNFNNDKMSIQNQVEAKKKIFDKSVEAINIFQKKDKQNEVIKLQLDLQNNNLLKNKLCLPLQDEDLMNQTCNQNFSSYGSYKNNNILNNTIGVNNNVMRIQTAKNQQKKQYFYSRQPEISPRRLEQLQNKVLQH